MKRERIVRIIARDARYRKDPFKDYPAFRDKWDTFVTGQHIVPGDPSTKDNLTKAEMTGKKPLSDEKLKRFPYVINPENVIYWTHMQPFDLSLDDEGNPVNPRDMALYNYARLQDYIANSKDEVSGPELYYIEDEEFSASNRIVRRDRIYEAENKVRGLGMDGLLNIALLLNHKYRNFFVDIANTPKDVIMDKIYEVIDKEPGVVLSCFTEGAQKELFVAKLHRYNIITRKEFSFYDGMEYLGDGLSGVVKYLSKDDEQSRARFSRWSARLQAVESGESMAAVVNPEREAIKLKEEMFKEMTKKIDALTAFSELVHKKIKIDHLHKMAEDNSYPRTEWEGIDAVADMKTYLIKKYRSINNI